jgi:hypothetical protein
MRRSFRTLRLCAIPGVSPRAGMQCPVGALRTPRLPRAPAPEPQHTCSATIIFPHRQQSTTPIEGQACQSTQRQRDRAGASIGSDQTPLLAQQRESLILPRASLRAQDRSRGAPVEAQTPSASPGTLPPENRCPHVPYERSTDPRSPTAHTPTGASPTTLLAPNTPFRDRLPQGTGSQSPSGSGIGPERALEANTLFPRARRES